MGKPSPASRRAAMEAQRREQARALRHTKVRAALAGALVAVCLVVGVTIWWNHRHHPAPPPSASSPSASSRLSPSAPSGTQLPVPDATADSSGMVAARTPAGSSGPTPDGTRRAASGTPT